MNNENELNLISGVVNAADEETYATEEKDTASEETESEVTDNSDNGSMPTDSTDDLGLGSDIVERIIDRVVERMTSNSRAGASVDAPETGQKRQSCSTPNFLSDIRPDFWDRI